MRQNAARVAHLALIAGLLLVVGLAGADIARAAATTQKPWLGVYLQELTPELREGLDYDGPGGAIVSRVVRGSPAEKAGLLRNDVIVRLNGRTVDTPSELTEMVGAASVGQRMSVQVFRDGASRTLGVTLGARPADAFMPRIEAEVEGSAGSARGARGAEGPEADREAHHHPRPRRPRGAGGARGARGPRGPRGLRPAR